jgi:VIT1/CCC1 family predicted Fe2+/Mn2+ transporter
MTQLTHTAGLEHRNTRVARPARIRRTIARATVREILMGAQDNLTNVIAVVLGVAIGSGRADFVALAGLSAGVAEAVSMGGVLYNSTRAEQRLDRSPEHYSDGPASGALAPALSGLVTMLAALVAGLAPLAPFLILPLGPALVASLSISVLGLFALGSVTGRLVGGTWWLEGIRLLLVAGVAALAAAAVGIILQVG